MKTPSWLQAWIRPKDAPIPELRTQLEHARAASAAATGKVADALAAFDASPSAATGEALREARDYAANMVELVGRAERLLVAAEKRKAEEDRRELEKQEQAAIAELQGLQARADDELPDSETKALERVAEVRVERLRNADAQRVVAGKLRKIRGELGHSPPLVLSTEGLNPHPSHVPVAARLRQRIAALPANDGRRALLQELIPSPSAYNQQQDAKL